MTHKSVAPAEVLQDQGRGKKVENEAHPAIHVDSTTAIHVSSTYNAQPATPRHGDIEDGETFRNHWTRGHNRSNHWGGPWWSLLRTRI